MIVEAGLIYLADHLFAVAIFNGNRCSKYLYNENIVEDVIKGNNNLGDLQVPEYLGEVILNCDRTMWNYFVLASTQDICYKQIESYKVEELMKKSLSLIEKIKKLNEGFL